MKVAISASGQGEGSKIDDRFGRCPYFIMVDTDEMDFKTIENEHTDKSHGVGPQVVQSLSEKGVDAVITSNVGPNAHQTLNSAGIKVYKASGKISDAVDKLKDGELEELDEKTVKGHFGGGRNR
ncbi:MAG: NifB/NifX family molybdenum-iron cluster-binding protein [Candidatus Saliniplasma sp.]